MVYIYRWNYVKYANNQDWPFGMRYEMQIKNFSCLYFTKKTFVRSIGSYFSDKASAPRYYRNHMFKNYKKKLSLQLLNRLARDTVTLECSYKSHLSASFLCKTFYYLKKA